MVTESDSSIIFDLSMGSSSCTPSPACPVSYTRKQGNLVQDFCVAQQPDFVPTGDGHVLMLNRTGMYVTAFYCSSNLSGLITVR
jgi:hypothetical protein